jgi:DNA-binding XRE family transcriptional regulator
MEKLPLKVHRVMQNMTQAEVAFAVGVGRLTYASWEKYETFPDAVQLIKLSEVFKCSLDAFYFPNKAS